MRVQHNVKVEISFTGFNAASRLELYHIQQLISENDISIKPYLRLIENMKKEEWFVDSNGKIGIYGKETYDNYNDFKLNWL